MSGTRKMEKFELDAYTKAREAGTGAEESEPSEQREPSEPNAPTTNPDYEDLPARPFDQRREPAALSAELPALPFEARRDASPASPTSPTSPTSRTSPTRPEPTDLPALPFTPMSSSPNEAITDPPPPIAPPIPVAPISDSSIRVAPELTEPQAPWEPNEWVPPQSADPSASSTSANIEPGVDSADALRTKLARKFTALADSVGEAFREFAIGAGAWAVELTAPQGMSTGGGKQALQHLRLRPRREGYTVVIAGTVNQLEKRAELRDFDHVTILHEVRFRNALEVSNQEWEQFLRKAEVVLNAAGIQSMRTPPPRELLEQRRNMQRISKGAIGALVVVLVLAAIVVWRVVVALSAQQ